MVSIVIVGTVCVRALQAPSTRKPDQLTKKAATPDERKAATSGEKEIEEKKGPAQPLEEDEPEGLTHKSSDALLSFLLLVAFLWLLYML